MINFRCEKCEFTTNRKDKLKTHIESKHYQNKIKCPKCSVEFTRKDNLVRHMKEYHPQDPLALMENHSTPTVVTSTPSIVSTPSVVVPTPEQASDTEVSEVPTTYQTFDTEVSAFNKRLVEKKWFIRGQKEILKVFTNYREKVNNAVTRALKKHQLKIDLVIKVRMSRQDQELSLIHI